MLAQFLVKNVDTLERFGKVLLAFFKKRKRFNLDNNAVVGSMVDLAGRREVELADRVEGEFTFTWRSVIQPVDGLIGINAGVDLNVRGIDGFHLLDLYENVRIGSY